MRWDDRMQLRLAAPRVYDALKEGTASLVARGKGEGTPKVKMWQVGRGGSKLDRLAVEACRFRVVSGRQDDEPRCLKGKGGGRKRGAKGCTKCRDFPDEGTTAS
jgi:hypothetical protein